MACLKTGLSYFSSGGSAEAGTRTYGPGIPHRSDRCDRRTCAGIASRLAESHAGRKCVPDAMSTAAGPTGGRAFRLSGKSGQSSFLVARTNASVSSEPITGNSKTSALTKKPGEALCQPGPSRHAEQHTALHLAPGRELRQAHRDGIGGKSNPNPESSIFVWHGRSMPRDSWCSIS
jgi:hypothetical protein